MDSWDLSAQLLARLAVAAFAAYAVYFFVFRKRSEFAIRLRRGSGKRQKPRCTEFSATTR